MTGLTVFEGGGASKPAGRHQKRQPSPPEEPEEIESERMPNNEVDTKIALSEARIAEKFALLRGDFGREFEAIRGEMKANAARLEGVVSATAGIKTTIVISAIAVVALVAAILAYGGDRFAAGTDIGGIIDKAANRAVEQTLPRQSLGTVDSSPTSAPSP